MSEGVILVTGATDGIGLETARQLAKRGYAVIVHGRDDARVEAAREVLHQATGAPPPPGVRADFSTLDAVDEMARELTARLDHLDALINNAGVYATERRESFDGYELTLAVNHLAPFLLTHRLLSLLRAADAARIVNVSSVAHTRGRIAVDDLQLTRAYDAYEAYAQSKLATVLFTVELARRLGSGHPTVNALHPGVVSTKLLTDGFGMRGPDSVEDAAATSVWLATDDAVHWTTGRYFRDCREAEMNPVARDPRLGRHLYEMSAELVGIEGLPEV